PVRALLAVLVLVCVGCGSSAPDGPTVSGSNPPPPAKAGEVDVERKAFALVEEQFGEILEDLAQAREQIVIAKKAVPSSGRDSIDVVIDLVDAAAGRVADLNNDLPTDETWKTFKTKLAATKKQWVNDLNDSLFEVAEAKRAVESLGDFASDERKVPYSMAGSSFADASTGLEVAIEALGGTVEQVDP
ncbi:MAG TPA: hypothetical protein PKA27_17565, partial [Fimbriimonadaceae bacterium]|nr:hypothetical protein [Fimbriimonadaceae bacterium]